MSIRPLAVALSCAALALSTGCALIAPTVRPIDPRPAIRASWAPSAMIAVLPTDPLPWRSRVYATGGRHGPPFTSFSHPQEPDFLPSLAQKLIAETWRDAGAASTVFLSNGSKPPRIPSRGGYCSDACSAACEPDCGRREFVCPPDCEGDPIADCCRPVGQRSTQPAAAAVYPADPIFFSLHSRLVHVRGRDGGEPSILHWPNTVFPFKTRLLVLPGCPAPKYAFDLELELELRDYNGDMVWRGEIEIARETCEEFAEQATGDRDAIGRALRPELAAAARKAAGEIGKIRRALNRPIRKRP